MNEKFARLLENKLEIFSFVYSVNVEIANEYKIYINLNLSYIPNTLEEMKEMVWFFFSICDIIDDDEMSIANGSDENELFSWYNIYDYISEYRDLKIDRIHIGRSVLSNCVSEIRRYSYIFFGKVCNNNEIIAALPFYFDDNLKGMMENYNRNRVYDEIDNYGVDIMKINGDFRLNRKTLADVVSGGSEQFKEKYGDIRLSFIFTDTANPSCYSTIPFESIWRPTVRKNDVMKNRLQKWQSFVVHRQHITYVYIPNIDIASAMFIIGMSPDPNSLVYDFVYMMAVKGDKKKVDEFMTDILYVNPKFKSFRDALSVFSSLRKRTPVS